MTGRLPSTASVAEDAGDGKLFAPAAARNAEALTALLARHAPRRGQALEIASGTGQHICAFGKALPGIVWQPSDLDPARLRSVDAHVREAGLENLRPAVALDACAPGWAARHGPFNLIVLINLLHLVSAAKARTLVEEAAAALHPGGQFIFYGPFARDGRLTSDGDRRFDAQLRAADPEIGYKDTAEVCDWIAAAGLACAAPLEMPANNLAFICRKEL